MRVAILFMLLLPLTVLPVFGQDPGGEGVGFAIRRFEVSGNTKLSQIDVERALKTFVGPEKTSDDVEAARTALEQVFHNRGYPTVLVNIPEQTVEGGIVQLEVIESKIRRVRITGNKYFSMTYIRKKLPSFKADEILYLPQIQQELAEINGNPDIKVAPVLIPGAKVGTIDVELQVKDRLPLHGEAELNNRSSNNTTDLRLNTLIRYDNLWQRDHSVSLQFQTSPEDTDEVNAWAGSYVLPVPWNPDQILALYGVWSDSEVAFGEGFNTVGKGVIIGGRYVILLPPKGLYSHSAGIGLDYKDFDEALGFKDGGEDLVTPINYMPLSFSYNGSLPGETGATRFNAGVNMALRGLQADEEEFLIKRFKSRGNYIYATAGIERNQKLPYQMGLFAKLDGQIADQPLPSNEQYAAGGMKSVRGYKESIALGDNALHTTIELGAPEVMGLLDLAKHFKFNPYLFFDYAALDVLEPLPGQDRSIQISGTGIGARGFLTKHLEYGIDWGVALEDTDQTQSGDQLFYFLVKAKF